MPVRGLQSADDTAVFGVGGHMDITELKAMVVAEYLPEVKDIDRPQYESMWVDLLESITTYVIHTYEGNVP